MPGVGSLVEGLLKWFLARNWGQLRVNLQKLWILARLLGAAPMTLSGLKSVDQQIRPPLATPVEAGPAFTWRS
jgi:hypothetical protein